MNGSSRQGNRIVEGELSLLLRVVGVPIWLDRPTKINMSEIPNARSSTSVGPKMTSIRVYLQISNRLLREAVGRLFRKTRDLVVIGAIGNTDSPDELSWEFAGDLVVADTFDPQSVSRFVNSPGEHGRSGNVLLIGMSDSPDQFLAAVRSGVTGYLMNNASAADILAAARAPFRGEAYCPPQLCLTLFQTIARGRMNLPTSAHAATPYLTLRQEKLVALVEKGLTNKEIAAHLSLSEYTVRNHIHRIMRRLRAGNRREAVDAIRMLRMTFELSHRNIGEIRQPSLDLERNITNR